MNLIDKAIEQHQGIWPKFCWESNKYSKNALVLVKCLDKYWDPEGVSVGDITLGGSAADPHYAQVVCVKEEFEKRAKELGWINGYYWGVEYQTNGKKPDLPDEHLKVQVCTDAWGWSEFNSPVGAVGWGEVEKFRITDERYKPKQPELSIDSSWYTRGELPPLGVDVEFKYKADKVWVGRTCVIIAVYGSQFWALLDGNRFSNLYELNKFYFRPIKSEREKFIEKLSEVLHSTENGVINDISLGQAYDAGFKAPK